MTSPPKPAPAPTPETQPFWDGCAEGELRIQKCRSCGRHVFYPRPTCPHCYADDLEWVVSDGTATLHSYVISHRAAPGFTAPYVIAIVELPEGVRMMTNLVDVEPDPDQLPLDMPLRVRFEQRGDVHLPLFAPAGSAA